MESKKRRFDKLEVYSAHRTVWLRVFLLGYVNIFIIVMLALLLTKLIEEDTWNAVIAFFSDGSLSLPTILVGVWILQFISALAVAVTLPLLRKPAFIFTQIHLCLLAAGYPLTILFTRLATGETPSAYARQGAFLYALELIFAVMNAIYFFKRQDLFYTSLTKMVTGREADPNKH